MATTSRKENVTAVELDKAIREVMPSNVTQTQTDSPSSQSSSFNHLSQILQGIEIEMENLEPKQQELEDGQLREDEPSMSSNLPSRTSTLNLSLPPVDGGKEAWIFVAAAFWIELCTWGFGFSYGVFQSYYLSSSSLFLSSTGQAPSTGMISTVGTLTIALPHCLPVILSNLFSMRPYWVKPMMVIGLFMSVISMFAASFCTSVGGLLVTQGIGFGTGAGLIFAPVMLWLPDWFYQRRGIAFGIVFSGAGLGGVILPLMINGLLRSVGLRWTLRFFGVFFFVVLGICTYFARPRVIIRAPTRDPSEPSLLSKEGLKGLSSLLPKARDFAFVLDSTWMIVATVQFIQSICYFAVSLYIVDYSVSVGASPSLSTGILSTFNSATIFAQMGTGFLVDKIAFPIVMVISCTSASLTAYLLLGFATTLPLVLIFVVLFGLVGGGFFTTSARGAPEIARKRNSPISLVIYTLMFSRGLASITGPLIAAALYRKDLEAQKTGYGSHGFAPIVLFVGSGMAVSSIIAGCFHYFRKVET